MHRVLRNQFKRTAGLASEQDIALALQEAKALAGTEGLSPQTASLLNGLEGLLARVSGSYEQNDRDMELRNRSLMLSSEELQTANERLRAEAEGQKQALRALRETADGLLGSLGGMDQDNGSDALPIPNTGEDSITALTSTILCLIDQRASALKALEQQKFAIDQHAIVSITDTHGLIIYANDLFCQISGYSQDELIGRNHRIVNSGLHEHAIFEEMWQTISRGQVWHGELCNRAKSGTLYWVSATIVPMMGDDGMPERYIAIRTDISQQKQMEEDLRTSRKFLQNITDSMGEGVFCLDSRGHCTFINPEAGRLLGWSLEELQGQPIHNIIHYKNARGEDIPLGQCPTLMHLAMGQPYRSEDEHYIRRDGTMFPVALATVPTWDNGRLSGSVTVFQDITERKRIQSALAESEDRLKVALEAANIGLWDWNPQTDVAYFGPKWLGMLGYAVGELPGVGHTWLTLLHPDDKPAVIAALDEHLSGQMPHYDVEFRMQHKDGSWIWVLSSGKVMRRDEYGQAVRITGIHKNITDRKRVEEELERAKEEADRANQFKSAFLANMSHEIRTPMNAVIGLSHLALQTELSSRQRDYLEKIHNASKNLLGILNDILDFSKIEAGKMDLEKIPFRLSDVLDNLVTVTLPKVREKSLSLDIDQAPDVPDTLLGDPLRLGQVLVNLVSNAVKFTEHGQIVISIAVEKTLRQDKDGPAALKLNFRVRDSGIGMTEDQIKGLFKAFTQADSSTTRRFGGTGLGLAISRQFVELMGGDISASSAPGRGSTFTFSITAELASDSSRDGSIPTDIRGMNVLVVDDNPTARVILSNTLRQYGFVVDVVVNGEDAIAAVDRKRNGYGFMVIDWRLPDIDGAEVCRRLRLMGHTRMPVLAVTAYGAEQAQESFAAVGPAVELLEKPITSTRLMDAVLSALGRRPRSGDGSQTTRDVDAIQGLLGAEVLLVEDNPINQQVARELLEGVGIAVTVCGRARLGIEALRSNTFDLVLMDIQMPEMDGYQATAIIRNTLHLMDLPVIAMTAHTMAGDREKCLDAGMNDHVGKPIDPDALFRVLVRWIKPRDRSQQAPHALPRAHGGDMTLPDHLDGFDLKAALRSVNGNAHLLRRLLVDFATGHGTEALILRPAIREGRLSEATRIAHTLKGTAATIGAMEVSRTAAILEKMLMQGEGNLDQAIDDLAVALGQVIRSVASMDPLPRRRSEKTAAPPTPVKVEDVRPVLDRLRDELTGADPSAEETAELLLQHLGTSDLVPLAEKALSATRNFDFDDALASLDALAQALDTVCEATP